MWICCWGIKEVYWGRIWGDWIWTPNIVSDILGQLYGKLGRMHIPLRTAGWWWGSEIDKYVKIPNLTCRALLCKSIQDTAGRTSLTDYQGLINSHNNNYSIIMLSVISFLKKKSSPHSHLNFAWCFGYSLQPCLVEEGIIIQEEFGQNQGAR